MKKLLVILLTILIYSCSKDDNNQISQYDLTADKNIILDNGKCLEIIDIEYEICLKSINDSRCPSGVECVWEGDAVVEFNFKSNTENKFFTLHTNDNFQQDTIINNLKIKLLNVFPYPDFNNPTNQSDYSAELSISEQ
jgi:hypothetical protein